MQRPARELEALQMGVAQRSRSFAENHAMSPSDKANNAQLSAMMDVHKIIAMQQSQWDQQMQDSSRPNSVGNSGGPVSRPPSAASPHPSGTPRPMSRAANPPNNDAYPQSVASPLIGLGSLDTRPGGLRRMASTSQASLIGPPRPPSGMGSVPQSPAMPQRPSSALARPPSVNGGGSLSGSSPAMSAPQTSIPVPSLNLPESTPLFKPDGFGLADETVLSAPESVPPASSAPNPVASIPVHAPVAIDNGVKAAATDDIATTVDPSHDPTHDLGDFEFDLEELMRDHEW